MLSLDRVVMGQLDGRAGAFQRADNARDGGSYGHEGLHGAAWISS